MNILQTIAKRTLESAMLSFCILGNYAYSQVPTPAKVQGKPILIVGATIHTATGRVVENGLIGFENGKITVIADAIQTSERAKYDIINAVGKHIYPGLIVPNTTLGLVEVEAVRATSDFEEVGSINPHVRSIIAYNTDSDITPTVRCNGVLMAQVTPRGGLVSGQSSVVQLDAWNWEDAAYRTDDGIHINWPKTFRRTGWWAEPGRIEKSKSKDKQVAEIEKLLTDALAYKALTNKEKNLKLEAMQGLFDGTKTLYIHTDVAKEIVESVRFAKAQQVKKIVIVGAYESYKVTDFLKENKVSVILQRLHNLPTSDDQDIDLPYKIPALLQKAGVLFCIDMEGNQEASESRNLPFQAGTAAAYGLDKEQALAAVSLNTAKILGIDARVGSLEPGKDATLVISDGDLLDMRSNNVTEAFIQGRKLDLSNKQKNLYKKFSDKYEH